MDENTTPDVTPATPAEVDPSAAASQSEKTVSKAVFDKTASELADLKKQLRAKMSEADLRAADIADRDAKLAEYERKERVNNIKLAIAESGVSDLTEVADVAELFAEGSVVDGVKSLMKSQAAQIKALQAKVDELSVAQSIYPGAGAPMDGEAAFRVQYQAAQSAKNRPEMMKLIQEAAKKGIILS